MPDRHPTRLAYVEVAHGELADRVSGDLKAVVGEMIDVWSMFVRNAVVLEQPLGWTCSG